MQLLVYTDDIAVIELNSSVRSSAFFRLNKGVKRIGLKANEGKKKLPSNNIYLNVSLEIQHSITPVSSYYFGRTKIKLFKSLIIPAIVLLNNVEA